jgi:2-haloacid dehalogenase
VHPARTFRGLLVDFSRFLVFSFDCYGTLIDWESGILGVLRPILKAHGLNLDDASLLELYAELEREAEQGEYRLYRDILEDVVRAISVRLRFTPTASELRLLSESLSMWSPFHDTVSALGALHRHYKLAVISNVDDDLFTSSQRKLGIDFDFVMTAQQARAYKPAPKIFQLAEERIGIARDQWLHVAQSIYHDIIPANSLGIATVWVNRPSARPGAGAVTAASGCPDLEVPNLAELASLGARAPMERRKA